MQPFSLCINMRSFALGHDITFTTALLPSQPHPCLFYFSNRVCPCADSPARVKLEIMRIPHWSCRMTKRKNVLGHWNLWVRHGWTMWARRHQGSDIADVYSSRSSKGLFRLTLWLTTYWKCATRFLTRALANDMFIFSDELDNDDNTCPQCKDRECFPSHKCHTRECAAVYMNGAGRILACGHELCFGTAFIIFFSGCTNRLFGM